MRAVLVLWVLLAVLCACSVTAVASDTRTQRITDASAHAATVAVAELQRMATVTRHTLHATWADARQAADALRASIAQALPAAARPLLHSALCGAMSVALVGPGLCTHATATRGDYADTHSARSDGDATRGVVVWGCASSKFCFSLGAVAAELLLLHCVYRTPHRNDERNRVNRLVSGSVVGWCALVALLALPQLVCNVGMLLLLTAQLSYDVYVPALVLGRLLQPYTTAAMLSSSWWSSAMTSMTTQSLWPWRSTVRDDVARHRRAQAQLTLALLTTLLTAALLYAMSYVRRDDDDDDEDDDESDTHNEHNENK